LTATLAPHDTTVTHATIRSKRRRALFTFAAAGSTSFQCALVKPRQDARHHKKPKLEFRGCTPPKSYKHLEHGRYTFEVRGVSSTGTVDPKPAIRKFKI
jgi:thymidylate synthase ThyX